MGLEKKKLITFAVVLAIAIAILAGGSFYFGFQVGEKYPQNLIVKGMTNLGPDEDVAVDFSIFWEAWNKLKNTHIKGAEIKNQELLYGALSGLADSFDDPNTVFMRPTDSKKFEEDVSGNFGGIGAEIDIRNDQLIIVAPLDGSPAEKASLRSGDKILAVDGDSTAGISLSDAVKKIRGEIGTTVILTILSKDEEKYRDVPIVRDHIVVPTLKWEIKDGDIAHLQLYSFNENAPFLFYKAVLEIFLNDARGMVLDLRNNPGGFLEVAIDLAGWFLDRGDIVVTEQFRSGEGMIFRASGNGALKDVPMVILINGGSASASEILAGALRDQKGIKLIGEKSFGKGTVQELFTLRDESSLKITVADWLLPAGQTIEDNGLEPDIEVKLTEEDFKNEKDPQLERAMEILKQEINKQ